MRSTPPPLPRRPPRARPLRSPSCRALRCEFNALLFVNLGPREGVRRSPERWAGVAPADPPPRSPPVVHSHAPEPRRVPPRRGTRTPCRTADTGPLPEAECPPGTGDGVHCRPRVPASPRTRPASPHRVSYPYSTAVSVAERHVKEWSAFRLRRARYRVRSYLRPGFLGNFVYRLLIRHSPPKPSTPVWGPSRAPPGAAARHK